MDLIYPGHRHIGRFSWLNLSEFASQRQGRRVTLSHRDGDRIRIVRGLIVPLRKRHVLG
jgi:hypothetical protein